ncbi:NAD-dependent epimerase/dehydratase family protein [Bradyrhizobium sp.]|uniref:NAD-dependent epimerase/dehydratase family protein n=1 Tax=Bradyrhizobium sp. TaxID=376 RepID=UPI00262C0032|nr:NAD-dependent epimerase/dehydratase family protein [Bradyrhizobium sp.]
MRIFCTGASGYIGGSIALALVAAGHDVSGLVRSDENAARVRSLGIAPVHGTLDDVDVLRAAAARADAIVHAANADHEPSARVMLAAIEGTGRAYIHTSGSSVVGTQSAGQRVDAFFDEDTPMIPSAGRAARVALNDDILSFKAKGIRAIVICPSLIYGISRGPTEHSMQVPWLIRLAKKAGVAKHYGPGENIWSNVHIDDLVDLYLLALASAPSGAFYFAENGENSMKQVCEGINRKLGIASGTLSMSFEEASREWGEGVAQNTMGSNSRVRAVRARRELGWRPNRPSLIEEIENGCYAACLAAR